MFYTTFKLINVNIFTECKRLIAQMVFSVNMMCLDRMLVADKIQMEAFEKLVKKDTFEANEFNEYFVTQDC